MLEFGDDALGDAHVGFDSEVGIAVVDEEDVDFVSEIGVDGAGGVEHGDAVFEGEAAAGADLEFVAGGDFYSYAGGEDFFVAWFEGDGLGDAGVKVESGGGGSLVLGEDGGFLEAFDFYLHVYSII